MNRKNKNAPQTKFTKSMVDGCKEKKANRQKYGAQWELNVFKGLQEFVDEFGSGFVHKMYKPHFSSQTIDILVDNIDGEYYGVECKASANLLPIPRNWFSQRRQLFEETKFLRLSARTGIIACVLPTLHPGPKLDFDFASYFVPWDVYLSAVYSGGKMCAGDFDLLAQNGLVVKIPTTDGTVTLPPDWFQRIQDALQRNDDVLATIRKKKAERGHRALTIRPETSMREFL